MEVGAVLYILSYKGKPYGEPMDLAKAEAVLVQMSRCLNGLTIMPYRQGHAVESASLQQQSG